MIRTRLQKASVIGGLLVLSALVWIRLSKRGEAQHYTTKVMIQHIEAFGQDKAAPALMDVALKFVECPGDARKLVRGDKAFSQCAVKLKAGDTVEAEVVSVYRADKEGYRTELVRLADCPIKVDPKEEANYESVQSCKDLQASGVTVGVRCERGRSAELLEKCPWFRR